MQYFLWGKVAGGVIVKWRMIGWYRQPGRFWLTAYEYWIFILKTI